MTLPSYSLIKIFLVIIKVLNFTKLIREALTYYIGNDTRNDLYGDLKRWDEEEARRDRDTISLIYETL
jgi:hypothetical protein